jgi:hypothetical protein
MMNKTLVPQPTEQTPYTVSDYPYGYTTRTSAQWWVETKQGKGERVVFRTLNPRTQQWNKPKFSTYSDIAVLALDDKNHVTNEGFSIAYSTEEDLNQWLSMHPEEALSEYQKKQVMFFRAILKARAHIKFTIVENPTPEKQAEIKQHEQETKELIPKLVIHYLREEEAKVGETQ